MDSVPLAKDEIKNVCGPTVYLLHFERPFKQSAHYLGCTNNLIARIAQHRAGRGARLLEVIGEYGIGFEVVRIWPGDRKLERRLKRWHAGPRLCPICQARRRAQRHQLRLF
jgi:predicted GIY-YIG superfamily endonuclease